jgi:phosphoglycerol geranylgeranyltransferase
MGEILNQLKTNARLGLKAFAVLIDPDKISNEDALINLIDSAVRHKVDYFLIGGSLITSDNFSEVIATIKKMCSIPTIIFPGNNMQIDSGANGILFLSLISGRNPEFLIGQHVIAAPVLKRTKIEVLSTGYILIDSGGASTVSYMSNTQPIPADKYSIAACTAMAGEMLGFKLMYLDGGSGAKNPISQKMISAVRKSIDLPLIVGGGINALAKATKALEAGADLIVIGNGIEENPELMMEVSEKVKAMNYSLNIHQ